MKQRLKEFDTVREYVDTAFENCPNVCVQRYNQGQALLKKDHATHKVTARLVHLLYGEFVQEFAIRD